jgi:hypothetical protein
MRINGATITFHPLLPKRFDRTGVLDRVADLVPVSTAKITHALAKVSARTPSAAFEEGQQSIDLLRGLWNYLLNFGTFPLFPVDIPMAINRILPAPLHTLHASDGSLMPDVFWYEPQGLSEREVYHADRQWSRVRRDSEPDYERSPIEAHSKLPLFDTPAHSTLGIIAHRLAVFGVSLSI